MSSKLFNTFLILNLDSFDTVLMAMIRWYTYIVVLICKLFAISFKIKLCNYIFNYFVFIQMLHVKCQHVSFLNGNLLPIVFFFAIFIGRHPILINQFNSLRIGLMIILKINYHIFWHELINSRLKIICNLFIKHIYNHYYLFFLYSIEHAAVLHNFSTKYILAMEFLIFSANYANFTQLAIINKLFKIHLTYARRLNVRYLY